ncbi:MAG: hypothetical protein AAGA48_06320 [Myxococcota bacterium]
MWTVLLVACGSPTEENEVAEPIALTWGSSNRSEAALVVPRGNGDDGYYVGLELAAPARTDGVLVSVDTTGDIAWQVQWGSLGDDEVDTIVVLDGQVAVGGRRLLNPTTDSDSLAVMTLIETTGPSVVDDTWWMWNASEENDRIAGIEALDAGFALAGGAGPQLLTAEIDEKAKTVDQLRFGPSRRTVEQAVSIGGGEFVLYGQATDPNDFNDPGQIWAGQVGPRGDLQREESFGELYQVEDRATDLVVLDDGAWLIAGETGINNGDVALIAVEPSGDVRFEVAWDSGGQDLDPQLAMSPEGTVFGASVRNRDELIVFTVDLQTGDVTRFSELVGVDRVRDLWVDEERICLAMALPGDVKGGYLASFACGGRDGEDGVVWPSLR